MEIKIKGAHIIFTIIGLILVAMLAVWVWAAVTVSESPTGPSQYSAVYLASGDIYFGKLSWIPQPHLADVWYLQRSADQTGKTQVAVSPLKNVFWGPIDEITLNPSQILFWTRLAKNSQLVAGFENPSSLQQQQSQQAGTGTPVMPAASSTTASSSTSTSK